MTSSSGSQVSTSTWKSRRAPVLPPLRRIAQATAAAALRNGEDPAVERPQRLGGGPRPRLEDFPAEMVEDRLQAGVVGQLVEVGEGALAEPGDREVFLGLSGLAEILDGPEAAQRRVEEGEEVSDEDVVEEEVPIAVRVPFPELVDEPLEGVEVLGADDRLGPEGQVARGRLGRSRAFGSFRRGTDAGRSLRGRHDGRV
jgi:hypothetical protein